MGVREILTWPDPRLAQRCVEVDADAIDAGLIADMFDTMYAAPGRGLAGPQIGVMQRLFVMDAGWKDGTPAPLAVINPRLLETEGEMVMREEGCLSIPGVMARVTRPEAVVLGWLDETGAEREGRFEGFAAACAQHEMDHLDGIVTLDRVSPIDRERLFAALAGPLS